MRLSKLDAWLHSLILNEPVLDLDRGCFNCTHSLIYDCVFYCTHPINLTLQNDGLEKLIANYLNIYNKTYIDIGEYCKIYERWIED